jgi:hypothetical protein
MYMTIENTESQLTAADEFAIQTTTNDLIRKAAAKSGMRFEDVPVEAREDALRYTKAAFAEEQAVKANPLYAQLQAEREAHRLTKMQMDAVKQTRIGAPSNAKGGPDPNVVRAQLGENNWRALTDNGRLQACGINPATVSPVEILEAKKVFGRGMDSHYSSNLSKQDWGRYQHLKRIAVVLNIQGQ